MVSDLASWHEVGPTRAAVLDVAALPESTFRPLLTTADRDETSRIRVPLGRRTAMASRALVRSVWAERLGVEPLRVPIRRWCRRCGALGHGRPYLDDPRASDFSVSHAGGLVVLALAEEGSVGVDIEVRREMDDVQRLAASTLTPSEAAHLQRGAGHLSYRFLALWTRKEAVVKLTGDGLSRPFDGVDTLRDPIVLDGFPGTIDLLSLPLPAGFVGHVAHSQTSRTA